MCAPRNRATTFFVFLVTNARGGKKKVENLTKTTRSSSLSLSLTKRCLKARISIFPPRLEVRVSELRWSRRRTRSSKLDSRSFALTLSPSGARQHQEAVGVGRRGGRRWEGKGAPRKEGRRGAESRTSAGQDG